MRIGVPKEIKNHEYRVGLTPASAREFAAAGHQILIETDAGAGINAANKDYRAAGASIASSADEIYASSEIIIKVKEPQEHEWKKLREGQILFTYLHLAANRELTKGLLNSGCTA